MPANHPVYSQNFGGNTLWDSRARQAVVDALFRAKADADATRRDVQQKLHGFLDGVHRGPLEERLSALYPQSAPNWNHNEVGHRYFPLIQMYADRLSVVFHRVPELRLVGADGTPIADERADQWRRDVDELELDCLLQTVERWINSGMRQAFVHVAVRSGRLCWEPVAPYEVWIDQDPEAPGRIDRAPHVTHVLPQRNDSQLVDDVDLYFTWEYVPRRNAWGVDVGGDWMCWLHDESGQLYRNPLFPDNVNRYGRHPLAVWRDSRPPAGDFWSAPNKAWLHAQLSADIKLVDLDHHLRHQIHSQPVLTGGADVQTIVSAPDSPLHIRDNESTFQYVSPDPKLALLIDGFNFDLRASAVAESLPPDTWEPNSSTRNLAAKQLEQAALRVRRERVLPFYRRALRETFAAHVAVSDFWADRMGRVRYGDARLEVEFAPLPEVVDRFQDSQASLAEINAGVSSPVEVVMRREGVTRTEAWRRLARRERDRARFSSQPEAPRPGAAGEGVPRPPSVED